MSVDLEVLSVLSACAALEPIPRVATLVPGDHITAGAVVGAGGFGTVYQCDTRPGGSGPGIVLKRHDPSPTLDPASCAGVISALHQNVDARWGNNPTAARAIWPALPFWVGHVRWAGRDVIVSLATDLSTAGYRAFEQVIEDAAELRNWLGAPIADRHLVALRLAELTVAAEEIGYVHADVNIENTFVDLGGGRATLIDFDGGWLPGAPGTGPLTWGKADDFVAPEVRARGVLNSSVIGRDSDRWSIGFLLHYLLFGVGPLFFLNTLSEASIRSYLSAHTWPDIDIRSKLFNQPNRSFYARYLQDLTDLPPVLVELFRRLVSRGTSDPSARPSAIEWSTALATTGTAPCFDLVAVSASATIATRPVRVAWSAPGATSVTIDGAGPYPEKGRAVVHLDRTRAIRLVATNVFRLDGPGHRSSRPLQRPTNQRRQHLTGERPCTAAADLAAPSFSCSHLHLANARTREAAPCGGTPAAGGCRLDAQPRALTGDGALQATRATQGDSGTVGHRLSSRPSGTDASPLALTGRPHKWRPMTVTSVLSNFLLWASAAPRHLVDQFPSERAKALGIGGAIMTTSGMAAASATFALHEVLHVPGRPALMGGIAWGAAVFNLDRWLVAAIRRRPTFLGNLAAFAPRFILAAVIGTVIAEPLVLRAFTPEIETELSLMQTEAAAEQTRTLAEDPRYASIPEMKAQVIELQAVVDGASELPSILEDPEVIDLTSRLDAKTAELAVAERAVICEHEGTCGSNLIGAGPAWREKVELRDRLRAEEVALQGQLETKKTEISDRLASTATARTGLS